MTSRWQPYRLPGSPSSRALLTTASADDHDMLCPGGPDGDSAVGNPRTAVDSALSTVDRSWKTPTDLWSDGGNVRVDFLTEPERPPVRCPYCAADDDRVIDSRPVDDGRAVRRRRECRACRQRFSTFERAAHEALTVRKRDGTTEPFRRDKLHLGMARALTNLDLDGETLRTSAARVEAQLRRAGRRTVTSEEIGRTVLDVLRDIHQVAYMRFASVYKGFTTPEDFAREIARLEEDGERAVGT